MGNDFNKEAHITGNAHSISQEEMEKILNQMNKCICKINYDNSFGTGFFCKIPISDNKKNYFLALITCNHALDNKIKGRIINLKINKIYHHLLIDENRKVFNDAIKDIIIIEIRKGELPNIEAFNLDENIFYKNPENIYDDIYILHFELGKEARFSSGVIACFDNIIINNTKLFYSCSTMPGSSGGPIINAKNFKVIGVHKGFDKKKFLNQGIFISDAIKKFQKWCKEKNYDYDDNNYKYNNNDQNYNFNEEDGQQNYNNIQYINQNYNINNNMNNNMNNNIYNNINNNLEHLEQISEIHEHPLILYIQNDKLCNLCLQNLNNTLAHKCNSFLINICQNCIANIFNGKININFHPHKLKLKYNNQVWA